MIAHFVSADHGWLDSPDGSETAMQVFRAGKVREGYFDNNDILVQFWKAVEMVHKYWPDEDHVFIYDNASTHLKRAPIACSASRMPKGPSENFFVEVKLKDGEGKEVGTEYHQMNDGWWIDNVVNW
uniref:Uncharacterized protein n=1 Tax=Moniliophthora roreri TaxID=221103 RepID=A0A0W0FJI1_MONRR